MVRGHYSSCGILLGAWYEFKRLGAELMENRWCNNLEHKIGSVSKKLRMKENVVLWRETATAVICGTVMAKALSQASIFERKQTDP